jgi:hypothetical protein
MVLLLSRRRIAHCLHGKHRSCMRLEAVTDITFDDLRRGPLEDRS